MTRLEQITEAIRENPEEIARLVLEMEQYAPCPTPDCNDMRHRIFAVALTKESDDAGNA